ncbi:hypothetical protein FP2506_03730 [Fulvimarina pelagi HTCC2506]|uniref:Auxin Efflux Carrier n=2 Tax=Fulvimarina pelagi TaxID=217511 RepID=Q0FZH2_9HYPH|nr:AEC family transporter [Fulvimarina pelagi]EAU40306.1 hypothetical protein FP2506_03730 [Fulvimarina pelagi HTCC2506]BAT31344.1 auxin Efflux Carrier [Fulvimarina pelagi]
MLFVTIWPIFALICLGYALFRAGFPDRSFWPAAERINYFLLFPALLFVNLADAPVRDPDILRLGSAVFVLIISATLALYGFRLLRPSPAARFGPAVQGIIRINTYLGLALTASLAGGEGLERAAILLAVLVPLVNVVSVAALTDGSSAGGSWGLLQSIVANPLILACLAGIAVALTKVGLPFGIERFLNLVAQASLPLGLLCVGAALRPDEVRQDTAILAGNTALRLLVMPLFGALIAHVFGLGETETLVLVIFAAIPTAPTAYVLTRQLGGDGPYMAGIITAQTLVSVVTIPLILTILSVG